MNLNDYINQADIIISNHFKRYKSISPDCGVLLSGGIDSSLITLYVLQNFISPPILSMGTNLTKDRPYVQLFVTHFKTTYEWVELHEKDIAESLPIVTDILIANKIEPSSMQKALAVGYFLIFKHAKALGVQRIITGQGPDVLFAGYHKYKAVSGKILEKEIKKDLILLEIDKKRDRAMALYFNITLLNPYLEDDFVAFALTIPTELKRKNDIEKYFIRMWGQSKGIPNEIVNRPKKAFQYSTGLQKKIHIIK